MEQTRAEAPIRAARDAPAPHRVPAQSPPPERRESPWPGARAPGDGQVDQERPPARGAGARRGGRGAPADAAAGPGTAERATGPPEAPGGGSRPTGPARRGAVSLETGVTGDGPSVETEPLARGEHIHSEPSAPSTGPPRRHSVRAQVLSALREALLTGQLAQGSVYSAPTLAERFGVSATPVREAMQQLASEGAVETVPNRGFRVAQHSSRDLTELAEIQAMLEIPVLLRLARTVPCEHWDGLRPLAESTLSAAARGDRAGFAEADRAFHCGLLELTGNRQLVMVADDLRRRGQSAVGTGAAPPTARGAAPSAAASPTELLASAAEHVALLDALAERDVAAAEQVARAHLSPAATVQGG